MNKKSAGRYSARTYALIFLGVVLLTAYIYRTSTFRPAHNFHEIDPGKFYRSAQPTDDELEEEVKKYGIKTVINLRGHQPGEWWYDDEEKVLDQLGVKLVNFGFSTERLQFKDDWVGYLKTLETAERPILVHCRSGADRTSEATAVYMMEYMHASKEQALEQVSLKYLHVSFFQPAKRFFVEEYKGKDWVINTYDPCAPGFREYAGDRCPDTEPLRSLTKEAP